MSFASPTPTSDDAPPTPTRGYATAGVRAAAMLLVVLGGSLVLAAGLAGLTFLLLPLFGVQDPLQSNTSVAAWGVIALIYGALLGIYGWALLNGRLSEPMRLPHPLFFLALFILSLSVGQGLLWLNVGTVYLFPVWHVLASGMIPLAVLAVAARALKGASIRSILVQFAWGGFATIILALVLELVLGVMIALAAGLLLLILVGPERLGRLMEGLTDFSTTPTQAVELLQREPTTLLIAGGAAIMLFVVAAPLLEEILKSVGPAVGLYRARRDGEARPTRGTALLWGLAAGAGYAFTENLLNAQGGVSTAPGAVLLWSVTMVLRAGTSLMHIAATATVAVGWYAALIQGQRAKLLLLLLAAWVAHGFWNITAAVLGSLSAVTLAGNPGNAPPIITVLSLLALGVLLLLILASALWIAWLLRWARRSD